MRDVPDFLGDRRGLDEELVRGVRKHLPRPLEGAYRVEGLLEPSFIGDVAGIGARALDLPLERNEPVAASREHRDGASSAREAPGDGCARPGSYPGDHHDWVRHAHLSDPLSLHWRPTPQGTATNAALTRPSPTPPGTAPSRSSCGRKPPVLYPADTSRSVASLR